MENTIDKLAILNLTAGSDLIEAVHIMEDNLKIHLVKIVHCDPHVWFNITYHGDTPDLYTAYFEGLQINCTDICSVIVSGTTSVLVEYSMVCI